MGAACGWLRLEPSASIGGQPGRVRLLGGPERSLARSGFAGQAAAFDDIAARLPPLVPAGAETGSGGEDGG